MSLALTAVLALSMGVAPAPPDDPPPAAESAPAPAPADEHQSGPVRDDEASAVHLVWDAPADECSDAATMQARLDEAMKLQLPDDPSARERWVIARVRKDGETWTLRLWVAPEGGLSERALTERSCAELERATLTIVAMLMPPVMVELNPAPPPTAGDMTPPPKDDPMGSDERGREEYGLFQAALTTFTAVVDRATGEDIRRTVAWNPCPPECHRQSVHAQTGRMACHC